MIALHARVRPISTSGTQWIAHKLGAMTRILSQYGVYTNHLASLSQDTTMKSADRAKIVGYYNKWTNAKYLLGCALFIDLLTPCAILSIDQWPTYALALGKCESKDGKVFISARI